LIKVRLKNFNHGSIDPDYKHENADAFSADSHESPIGLSRSSFSIAIMIAVKNAGHCEAVPAGGYP
jgi:hypothetical protein